MTKQRRLYSYTNSLTFTSAKSTRSSPFTTTGAIQHSMSVTEISKHEIDLLIERFNTEFVKKFAGSALGESIG
jgi:hypothetical protein